MGKVTVTVTAIVVAMAIVMVRPTPVLVLVAMDAVSGGGCPTYDVYAHVLSSAYAFLRAESSAVAAGETSPEEAVGSSVMSIAGSCERAHVRVACVFACRGTCE